MNKNIIFKYSLFHNSFCLFLKSFFPIEIIPQNNIIYFPKLLTHLSLCHNHILYHLATLSSRLSECSLFVFFPVTCIPVHPQSSTAISPVIRFLYSTTGSSRSDQVITYTKFKKKSKMNLLTKIKNKKKTTNFYTKICLLFA